MTATVRGTRVRRAAALPLLLVALASFAACSTPVDYGPKPQLTGSDTKVTTKPSFYGQVVSDSNARTLYQFSADRNGQPSCYDACAQTWQPFIATGVPTQVDQNVNSLEQSELTTVARSDGQRQVSYMGHPLYFYALDGQPVNTYQPDDVKGTGLSQFGGRWTAVNLQGGSVNP